jgi:hypothetical protein
MVSFIGGENMSMQRKPPTSHKVTGKLNHVMLYRVVSLSKDETTEANK